MSRLSDLVAIIERLRGPDGCPWDRAQNWHTMRPYLLEETYEVLDAVNGGAPEAVAEELGDLLFVVLLLVQMGGDLESGAFSLEDVAGRIADKMVRRHPHVFAADATPLAAPMGVQAWEDRKAQEGPGAQPRSRLAGVPRTLPALLRAHRQSEKAATVGFDWPDARGVLDKVREELDELEEALEAGDPAAVEHEYGDLLMALGSLGGHLQVSPEDALQGANDRFRDRFQRMERLTWQRGSSLRELDDAGLDALWNEAKAQLGRAPSPAPDGE